MPIFIKNQYKYIYEIMDKIKIKEIFGNIIQLILKFSDNMIDFIGDLDKSVGTTNEQIFKHLIDLNNRFSEYKMRDDLDLEAKAKKNEIFKDELKKAKEKTEKMKSEIEFKASQHILKMTDNKNLLKDILHLIKEL